MNVTQDEEEFALKAILVAGFTLLDIFNYLWDPPIRTSLHFRFDFVVCIPFISFPSAQTFRNLELAHSSSSERRHVVSLQLPSTDSAAVAISIRFAW